MMSQPWTPTSLNGSVAERDPAYGLVPRRRDPSPDQCGPCGPCGLGHAQLQMLNDGR